MSHRIALRFLTKIDAKKCMTSEEYEDVCYCIECLLINFFKIIQIYLVALTLNTVWETFIMNISYSLLRVQARGWHALSSLHCSLTSLGTFVGIPLIVNFFHLYKFSEASFLLVPFILVFTFLYAPSDTEKNPMISVSERRKKHIYALATATSVILTAFFQTNLLIRLLLLLGMAIECVVVSPQFYKLMKRKYNNYEKYKE
ncbi:MAG: accessory gene regulator AgrB [Lactobacillales bacterium]|nr:accessory gene regulator AgrB [Lactobacillales bacterium]